VRGADWPPCEWRPCMWKMVLPGRIELPTSALPEPRYGMSVRPQHIWRSSLFDGNGCYVPPYGHNGRAGSVCREIWNGAPGRPDHPKTGNNCAAPPCYFLNKCQSPVQSSGGAFANTRTLPSIVWLGPSSGAPARAAVKCFSASGQCPDRYAASPS